MCEYQQNIDAARAKEFVYAIYIGRQGEIDKSVIKVHVNNAPRFQKKFSNMVGGQFFLTHFVPEGFKVNFNGPFGYTLTGWYGAEIL